MERKDLESAAAKVTYLRGLLAIPAGLLWILAGLGNLRSGPFVHTWVFVGCLSVLVAAALLVNRYYNDNYGRVTRTRPQQVRYAASSVILLLAMVGGPILDSSFDLPVSAFATAVALAMLAWFAICVELKAYHVVIWGSLLLVGLLPVWGSLADKVSVAFLVIGVAMIVAGTFDHLALVRSFGPARDLDLESSNAGA